MKGIKWFALVIGLLVMLASCSGNPPTTDPPATNVTATWDKNPEADVTHYNLMFWVGDSSNLAPYLPDTPRSWYVGHEVTVVGQQTPDTITFVLPLSEREVFIQVAVSAVNRWGQESNIAASDIIYRD